LESWRREWGCTYHIYSKPGNKQKRKKNLLKKQSQQKLSQSVKYSLSSHRPNVGCAPIVRVLHTFSRVQPCPGPWMTGR
jgi:hypothetical protein